MMRNIKSYFTVLFLALSVLFMNVQDVQAAEFIVPADAQISLQRQVDSPGEGAILVVRHGAEEENCADVKSLAAKISLVDKTLAIHIKGYENDNRTAGKANMCAVARIGMDPQILERSNVNKVAFSLDGKKDVYELQLSNTVVRLVASSGVSTITPDKSYKNVLDPLYFWRLPDNTVALFTKNAKDPHIKTEIERFAQQKGMSVMKDVIPNYVPRYRETDRYLFVDNEGIVRQLLKDDPEIPLGSISFPRTVKTGADGQRNKIFTERVYAKRVNIMD